MLYWTGCLAIEACQEAKAHKRLLVSSTLPLHQTTADDEFAAVEATYDTRPPFEARLAARTKMVTKSRAQRLLRLLIAALGFLTRPRQGAAPLLEAGNRAIQRILVIRIDLIGDVVLSLPAVRALQRAYPQAAIDMLVLE